MSDGYRELAKSREHWDATRDAEIERLRGLLREWRETFDSFSPSIDDRSYFHAVAGRTDAALAGAAVQPSGVNHE